MGQVVTLRQLGDRFGVDVGQIKRLVRVGSLPEAIKETSPSGKRWVIPIDKIEEIAERHGWVVSEINLQAEGDPTVSFAHSASATEAQEDPETEVQPTSEDAEGLVPSVPHECDTENNSDTDPAPTASPMALTPLREQDRSRPPLPPAELKVRQPVATGSAAVALSDILNEDLLSRLLGAHEDKATAQARVRETERALTSLTASHRHVSMQLSEERKEREILADRLRDERNSRLQADAKVAELRQRVARETAIAESEQRARQSATERSVKAERDSATALGSMGVVSRRRYERRLKKHS